MARSVDTINSSIVASLVIQFAAIGITINPTLWSKRDMLRAICYTVATCQGIMEQLQDLYKANLEDIVSKAAPATAPWIQKKMFEFQYSATNPQVLALIDVIPVYPIIDPTLRIITACSVTTDISNSNSIKVATGNPLLALTAPQISSAQGYINTIGTAGITYTIISLNPDKLFIDAQIFYAGQYAAVIKTNVITAINNYLRTLSITNFNGALKMSDLEALIRNVTGVNDVKLNNVRARAATDPYSAGVDLILSSAIVQRQFVTIAGYIAGEDTVTKTFADTLQFTAE